uniref:Uncharacterized protein n=1 Tax=Mycena chlorophos TaxID=658473 RepID=A0ABQ0LD89_MYCCL|nr:predicted protein [Mycena chlorophos]
MTEPRLPKPYAEGPDASETEQDAWSTSIDTFISHLIQTKLSAKTTASQLFLDARFGAPQHKPALYYWACGSLLRATREHPLAGDFIPMVAELFRLIKEEGVKRDEDELARVTWGNAFVHPVLRAIADDVPVPPGYKLDPLQSELVIDPEYVEDDEDEDALLSALAEYGVQHQGMLRFWSLVGRLEAMHVFGDGDSAGAMTLRYHSGDAMLRVLEFPLILAPWETCWAAVPMLKPGNDRFPAGKWNAGDERAKGWREEFLSAAKKIVEDERPTMEWRGRFAILVEALEGDR